MRACAIGQAHDQETLPLVLGAAEQLERQTRARVIGIMNVNFFRSLILSSMSLPRWRGFSPHIGESTAPPRITPARGPPAWDDLPADAVLDWDTLAQPQPEYVFDQQVRYQPSPVA
jgi:hypothetical protein